MEVEHINKLKKGDKVVMHSCFEAHYDEGKIYTCKTDSEQMCGSEVVWLENYNGGAFSTECLQKIDIDGYLNNLSKEKQNAKRNELN